MVVSHHSAVASKEAHGFWHGFAQKPDYISYDFISLITKPTLLIFGLLQIRNLAYQQWLPSLFNLFIFISLLVAVRFFRQQKCFWLMPLSLGGGLTASGVVGSFFLPYDAALWVICGTVTMFTTLHFRHALVLAPLGFLLTMPQLYNQIGFPTMFRFAAVNILLMVFMYGFTRSMADRYIQMLKESMTDSLTGLINRRAMINELEKWFQYCQRYPNNSLVLVMMDIDHFKAINDNFGHQAGDKVLKRFAYKAKAFIRDSDSLARYGGEEFLLLLPNTDEQGAERMLQKLRGSLAYHREPDQEELKFSAGITRLRSYDSIDSWLQRVDTAMYQAKEAGRDRSIVL